jgi:hypothetical protein
MSALASGDIESSLTTDGSTEQTVHALVETVNVLVDRVEELEEQLKEESTRAAKERAEINKRVSETEEMINADETPTATGGGDDGSTPRGCEPQTPLEEVTQLPEHVVEDNLTRNQERARFIAKDVSEYTRSVPAGRAIRSSEIRTVLSAGYDERIYTQTVSRVIEFLTELGGDDVQLKETRSGERVVVFSDAITERLTRLSQTDNGVVTPHGVQTTP